MAITSYSYTSGWKMLHFCSRHGSNSIGKLYSLRFQVENSDWFRHTVYSDGYKASAKFQLWHSPLQLVFWRKEILSSMARSFNGWHRLLAKHITSTFDTFQLLCDEDCKSNEVRCNKRGCAARHSDKLLQCIRTQVRDAKMSATFWCIKINQSMHRRIKSENVPMSPCCP